MICTIKKYIFKSVFMMALIAVVMISCATAGSQTGASDMASRQRLYMAHLREKGYIPSIDEDGDIFFKREGSSYFIYIERNDPSFTSILLPGIASLNSDADRARAAAAVSFANSNTKVAKAYISGSQDQLVTIAAEIYLENPNDFAVLFERLMMTIDSAKEDFRSKM